MYDKNTHSLTDQQEFFVTESEMLEEQSDPSAGQQSVQIQSENNDDI